MRILNLYAGIGGNRKLWGDEHQITAVENKVEIAQIYNNFFPKDRMVLADAHKFLLEHYDEYDFIWSSPPCPTHSRIRQFSAVGRGQNKPVYPSMKLYQEIIFLKHNFKGKWVVENVISYYEPLIKPYVYREHYYWANFVIDGKKNGNRGHNLVNEQLEKIKGFDLSNYYGIDKKKILRNCVEPQAGLDILNMAFKNKQITLEDL